LNRNSWRIWYKEEGAQPLEGTGTIEKNKKRNGDMVSPRDPEGIGGRGDIESGVRARTEQTAQLEEVTNSTIVEVPFLGTSTRTAANINQAYLGRALSVDGLHIQRTTDVRRRAHPKEGYTCLSPRMT
jgi:hypothetical protein